MADIQPKKINVLAAKGQKVVGKKTDAAKINPPKLAASQPKKVNAPANKKASVIGKKSETVAYANIKTDKAELPAAVLHPIS